jgi:hypothetical protein
MSDLVGYVVIEYNQASHQPKVSSDIYDDIEEAFDDLGRQSDATAQVGRREGYALGTIIIADDE